LYPRLKDSLNLLAHFTPGRSANLVRLFSSYYLSRFTGKMTQKGKPFTVSIEPTTSCNLRCPECPSGLRKFTRATGSISMEMYQQVIDQLFPDLLYLNLYFQGEPYLHLHFFKMVEYARKKNIYTATSTNGHFLTDEAAKMTVESGLDRIIISLDGLDQETYEKYRIGGSIDRVMEGIRNLAKWKKELKSITPFIILQFIVFRTNEHQVPFLLKLAKELGVDKVEIKSAQLYQYEDGNPFIPVNESFSRYKKKKGEKYIIDNPLNNHCLRMWLGCVVTWDGLVVPCCFDKDATYLLGDLKKQNFREIWRGPAYNNFRKKVFSGRNEIDICRNCTET
jgi:radical SAM protein with 4Fe4S-binding SPASM domain